MIAIDKKKLYFTFKSVTINKPTHTEKSLITKTIIINPSSSHHTCHPTNSKVKRKNLYKNSRIIDYRVKYRKSTLYWSRENQKKWGKTNESFTPPYGVEERESSNACARNFYSKKVSFFTTLIINIIGFRVIHHHQPSKKYLILASLSTSDVFSFSQSFAEGGSYWKSSRRRDIVFICIDLSIDLFILNYCNMVGTRATATVTSPPMGPITSEKFHLKWDSHLPHLNNALSSLLR